MNQCEIDVKSIYEISPDIISREIEGELIILPFHSGVGNIEDDMYTLNNTGKEVWKHLNGNHRLDDIINEISIEYNAPYHQIKDDITALIHTLLEKKMILRKC